VNLKGAKLSFTSLQCCIAHTDVTTTAETSIVYFYKFPPNKNASRLEGGNYYADKLFSNCRFLAVI